MAATPTRLASGQRHTVLAGGFVVTSFLGAWLLFLVQPMVGRFLLPVAGGSASLWNTALVFFMTALLLGYVLAHVSTRRIGIRRHPYAQLLLLAVPLLVLPISLPDDWRLPADGSAALWVLLALAMMVGLPFLALATSSPTLQYWFSATGHRQAHDPYFLYAAGNVGAVAALLAYPFLIEPWLSLRNQAWLWAAGYVVFLLCSAGCAIAVLRAPPADTLTVEASREPLAIGSKLRWLAWAFVPAALMLGVTRHIATDIASFPLLWIVPLLLYLATFVIAFGRDSTRRDTMVRVAVWVGAAGLAALVVAPESWFLPIVVVHLAWFFVVALLAHSKLASDRPEPSRLTEFYMVISVGGALGGVFGALIAPVLFDTTLEYPIAIGLALVIAIPTTQSHVSTASWLIVAGVLAVVIAIPTIPSPWEVFQDRSFFGVYTVKEEDGVRTIVSGTTEHGTQLLDDPLRPTSYYHDAGPIGQVLSEIASPARVGVVGLGAGALAAYGGPGDHYTFYEIDPLVVDIATSDLFTFVADSRADVDIEVVDGRIGLAEETDRFDVLVIDAFSSDAIPVHLMTREAVALYLSRLAPGGLLMMHVSNRYFDLTPVVGRAAYELGALAAAQRFSPTTAEQLEHALAATWIGVTPSPTRFSEVFGDARWEPLPASGPDWTDDYSNILSVLDLDT